MYVSMRIYLAIVFELVHSTWVLVGSCVIASMLSAFLFTWYVPYHRYFFGQLRVVATWIYAFASLCLVVTKITNDESKSQAALFFFLFSPVVAWVALKALEARKKMVLAKTIKQCRSPFEVELKIRFHLEQAGCLRKSVDQCTREGFDKTAFVREINGWFQEAVKRFHESSLIHIFWGQFHLHSTRKRNLALTEFVKAADDFHPQLDEQFIVYRMRKMLTEDAAFNKNSMDAIAYVTFQRDMRDARKYDRRAAHLQMLFWKELAETRPDTKRLYATGLKISMALSVARDSYERLMRTNATSPQVLRMYAGFLIYSAKDARYGEDLLVRADELEEMQVSQSTELSSTQLFTDQNATISISCEVGREGEVVDTNQLALRLFGFKRAELLGRSINTIIPRAMAEHHNQIIRDTVDKGNADTEADSEIVARRFVLGLHKSGHLVPVTIVVKQVFDDKKGAIFIAALIPFVTSDHFILLDKNDGIIGCTSGCAELFGSRADMLLTGAIHIGSWLNETPSTFNGKTEEIALRQRLTSGIYDIHINSKPWNVHGDDFSILRLSAECVIDTRTRPTLDGHSSFNALTTDITATALHGEGGTVAQASNAATATADAISAAIRAAMASFPPIPSLADAEPLTGGYIVADLGAEVIHAAVAAPTLAPAPASSSSSSRPKTMEDTPIRRTQPHTPPPSRRPPPLEAAAPAAGVGQSGEDATSRAIREATARLFGAVPDEDDGPRSGAALLDGGYSAPDKYGVIEYHEGDGDDSENNPMSAAQALGRGSRESVPSKGKESKGSMDSMEMHPRRNKEAPVNVHFEDSDGADSNVANDSDDNNNNSDGYARGRKGSSTNVSVEAVRLSVDSARGANGGGPGEDQGGLGALFKKKENAMKDNSMDEKYGAYEDDEHEGSVSSSRVSMSRHTKRHCARFPRATKSGLRKASCLSLAFWL
eukprot:Opistho-2@92480